MEHRWIPGCRVLGLVSGSLAFDERHLWLHTVRVVAGLLFLIVVAVFAIVHIFPIVTIPETLFHTGGAPSWAATLFGDGGPEPGDESVKKSK